MNVRTRSQPDGSAEPARSEREMAAAWELFLLRLRHREGRLLATTTHEPIALDDPDSIWIVYAGHLQVFAVPTRDGQVSGPRRHLFRAGAGEAVCGLDLQGGSVGLVAQRLPGTQILRVKRSALARLAEEPEYLPLVARLLESWIVGLSAGLTSEFPPREMHLLDAGTDPGARNELDVPAEGAARPRDGVLWVHHAAGSSRYLGRQALPLVGGAAAIPLTRGTWLESVDGARLSAATTDTVLRDGKTWDLLDHFHKLALAALAADAERHRTQDSERLAEQARLGQEQLGGAFARLTSVLAPRVDAWAEIDTRDPLIAACRLVGDAIGVSITVPPLAHQATVRNNLVQEIARASRIRTRAVALRGPWWDGEHGPLLGYLMDERRAVALLPASGGGYELHDPTQQVRLRITPEVSNRLRPLAYAFYRRFERAPVTAWEMLRFSLRGSHHDLRRVLLLGVVIGLLGLLVPIVTGLLFDLVIPSGQWSLVLQLGAGLAVAALATAAFELTRAIAVLRLSGALGATEAALMDRLLELPLPFFRQYTAGDLGQRALGLQTFRETLTGGTVVTLLASVFSLFNLVLLFAYDGRLALLACGLLLVFGVALATAGSLNLHYQRILGRLAGQVAGTTLQLITGLSKLRTAGAEERAFAFWAVRFAEQRRVAYAARKVDDARAVFDASYPVLASLVLFGVVALALTPRPSVGAFLALNVAFGQLLAAQLALGDVLTALLRVMPSYERARPILQAPLEVRAGQVEPGELSGAIAIDHVSFRYSPDGPLILDDVSLECRPGELIAVVGPSGSGKSTLLRLLLGFEAPDAGAILYDGRNLNTLDARAVRRQIGTVLQTGRLMTGDIFSNIVGASMMSMDDAWEAVERAQLKADIEAMPMGMLTSIGEGGSTLSGGQRQRLLIARAVLKRPRLIFFDEATSALDNRAQAQVSKSLEALAATRVVIAHRLSTVVNADRIYVMKNGRIVEQGTYRELMQRRGVFADLARRQIA